MKIGYVGDSKVKDFHSARRFRLASYSSERFVEITQLNLVGLAQNLEYAATNNLLFYRIRSDIIPFASHPICTDNWHQLFKDIFQELGSFITKHAMRVSTHPDQFILLNSPNPKTVVTSIKELQYHADMFNLMKLDTTHKIQLHVGGVYDDKRESMKRFIQTFMELPNAIQQRLVIENDDRLFSVNDCYAIYQETGIPIIFDNLHFELKNDGEEMLEAAKKCFSTWDAKDGIPMIDYSSQQQGLRIGRHSDEIDVEQFRQFITLTRPLDFDIMLEIKDKDVSALKALRVLDL